MKLRAAELLKNIDARVIAIVMLMLVCLILVEGWMLVLRAPYAEFRSIRATHQALATSVQQSQQQGSELRKVASELKLLSAKLSGQLRVPASDDELVAALMAALDQSAARYGIALSGMKPGQRRQVSVFEEVAFEVTGNGNYLQLCRWMLDFEQTLGGSATITEFDMKATETMAT
jgi:Tfp pilus assembly protein PilO